MTSSLRRASLAVLMSVLPYSTTFAADWVIDKTQSEIAFAGVQDGQAFKAVFTDYLLAVQFDPQHPETAHITADLPLASVKSDSPMVMAEYAKPEWLDVKAFPVARFVASSVSKVDDAHFMADGTLTIRGVSLPFTLPFSFVAAADKSARVEASVTLKRNDYGVGQGAWANDPTVAQDVVVSLKLHAQEKGNP